MEKLLDRTLSFAPMRFHNLTKLDVAIDWHLLAEFLESAHKLESLTIQGTLRPRCWKEPNHLPKCLLSSLKDISILEFAGGEHEFNLVRYILRHAKVLERIKIYLVYWREDAYFDLRTFQQLLDIPRESKTCRLTFVWDLNI